MRFFRRIEENVDISSLLAEVQGNEPAWLIDTTRQSRIACQRETEVIALKKALPRPDLTLRENQESERTAVSDRFPKAMRFLSAFAQQMNAQLSRATIVRLKPRSEVSWHIDAGSYYFIRDRYHLVLDSLAGSLLRCADEAVRMRSGELWWFDNKQVHMARNESDAWRIHYIFDLLPGRFEHLAVNPKPLRQIKTAPGPTPSEARPPAPERERLRAAIQEHGILRADGDRLLLGPNGAPNRWLLDLRGLLLGGRWLDAVTELFFNAVADYESFQVGGLEAGAIPLVTAIVCAGVRRGRTVNGFIVRKERKPYGTAARFEGRITDDPIIIVDDVLNSGSSLEKVRVVLESEGKKPACAVVLIDYRSPRGMAWRAEQQVPVRAHFGLEDFGLERVDAESSSELTSFKNIWRFASPEPNTFHRVPKSFPITDGERLYFGSDRGTFWCLDAKDGAVMWQFDVNRRGRKNLWSSPALHQGRVLFGSYDGNVYCLDGQTGKEVWRHGEADWVGSSPALAPELGLLFIGLEFSIEGRRGSIVALSLETGEKMWEYVTTRYTHASPAYWSARQLVACGSNDNEMLLFDARTGSRLWRFETHSGEGKKGSIRHAPAFDFKRGHIITACANGTIYIIDVETGQEVWSVTTGDTLYTVPLALEDTAYIGSTDKYLYVLDLENRCVKRKIFAGARIFSPPRLLEGRVYFGACNGKLYEIEPTTEEISGTHQLPDAITNALTFNPVTGYFYALTYANELFALQRL